MPFKVPYRLTFDPHDTSPGPKRLIPGYGNAGWTVATFATVADAHAFMAAYPSAEMPCWRRMVPWHSCEEPSDRVRCEFRGEYGPRCPRPEPGTAVCMGSRFARWADACIAGLLDCDAILAGPSPDPISASVCR